MKRLLESEENQGDPREKCTVNFYNTELLFNSQFQLFTLSYFAGRGICFRL